MQVLYIAGYGRSGSTLLERILSSHPLITGLGEVEYLTRNSKKLEALCSCGTKLKTCPQWKEILSQLDLKYDWSMVKKEQNKADSWKPFLNKKSGKYPHYDQFNSELYYLLSQQNQKTKYLIDSSKTARLNYHRPASLLRQGISVKIIHLIRDGRGSMWSLINRGSNRLLEENGSGKVPLPAARALFSWNLANIGALKWKKKAPSNYLQIRYEDFTQNPQKILREIQQYLDIDLTHQIQLITEQQPLPTLHQAAGNRNRSEKITRIKEDNQWRECLPIFHKTLFRLVSHKLAKQFGYI